MRVPVGASGAGIAETTSRMDSSWWSILPRVVRWPVVGVAFGAGVAATALAMAIGLRQPTGCPSRVTRAHFAARGTRDAAMRFILERNRCPATEDELFTAGYADGIARDPWGRELRLSCTTSSAADDVTVTSAGPDRIFGTADDIVESL